MLSGCCAAKPAGSLVSQDVPHLPADESDLRAQLHAAHEAISARDDFLAIAAHELRSPMNALSLRLATLERLAQQGGQDRLHQEIHRTRRTVDRYVKRAVVLLDVSHLNARTLHLSRVPVRLAEVVQDVIDAHADEAAFHGTAITADIEADPTGCWDPHMIEQVLGNLVNNALKYGNGTPVRVKAGLSAPDVAAFEVADEGPGIGEAERARIFEKFERVVSTSRDRAGFGLGLWIVGRMVAAHQGHITVTARPGGGSLFRVELPLAAPPASPMENDL
jgi:two-component system OmpR family sensor kinase